jgi:hypothetical protein
MALSPSSWGTRCTSEVSRLLSSSLTQRGGGRGVSDQMLSSCLTQNGGVSRPYGVPVNPMLGLAVVKQTLH